MAAGPDGPRSSPQNPFSTGLSRCSVYRLASLLSDETFKRLIPYTDQNGRKGHQSVCLIPPVEDRMTTSKKILIGVGAVALIAIVIGVTVWQSHKGVVEVQTGKVARLDLASTVTASGEI